MKRTIIGLFCLIAMSVAAIPAGAQTRTRLSNDSRYEQQRRYDRRTDSSFDQSRYGSSFVYDNSRYAYDPYVYDNRSVWDKSRDKITTAVGAGAGAVIGGLIGGGKGAVIGAIAGGGSAALYTYKIRDKYPYYPN